MARLLVAGLIVAAAATTPLIAQAVAPQPMRMGAAKTITRADVQVRTQAQFAKRDTNRDGFLAADEMRGRGGERGMRNRGARGEGAMRDPNAAFDRIDANRDGTLSRDEFARSREVRIEKRVIVNNADGKGTMDRRGMREMRRGGGGMMGAMMLRRADANSDGRITLAEATSGALAVFDRLDSNRDGRLTPEERQAGRAQMRQMRRAG